MDTMYEGQDYLLKPAENYKGFLRRGDLLQAHTAHYEPANIDTDIQPGDIFTVWREKDTQNEWSLLPEASEKPWVLAIDHLRNRMYPVCLIYFHRMEPKDKPLTVDDIEHAIQARMEHMEEHGMVDTGAFRELHKLQGYILCDDSYPPYHTPKDEE